MRIIADYQGQLDIVTAKYHGVMGSKEVGISEHNLIYEAVKELDLNKVISMMEYHYSNSKTIILEGYHED
ncbi:hypothetical protein [Brevibacillus sp. NRS-1366]|uniref:hypothetical protein n=1 Tax=Brevibacillus sp. NRS-1366 TaxID=3233899 RepID=UPI003D1C03A4